MILVISDDFTGAAEMAGIAMEFGLNTEIQTSFAMESRADVIIVDTNTRSKTSEVATAKIDSLLKKVSNYEFCFIYKKVDSVLRGHILEELMVLLRYYLDCSILMLPANPSRGRIISKGSYLIDGRPLHKTFFANDPEYPVKASDIYSLINAEGEEKIQVIGNSLDLPHTKGMIYVPDVNNIDQIKQWSKEIDNNLIPAGAAEFWKAILNSKKNVGDQDYNFQVNFEVKNRLFVCGSSLSEAEVIETMLSSKKTKTVQIVEEDLQSNGNDKNISEDLGIEIVDLFSSYQNVILTVKVAELPSKISKYNFPKLLARITSNVSSKIKVGEFFIEGGTTASEVVRKISSGKLKPITLFSQGIIRMQVVDRLSLKITVKPGSYNWPEKMWIELGKSK